jgi:hypothetical protein
MKNNFDQEIMSFPDYKFKNKTINLKSRVRTYVRSSFDYVRRRDPEEP